MTAGRVVQIVSSSFASNSFRQENLDSISIVNM